jgi:hypothetical protein
MGIILPLRRKFSPQQIIVAMALVTANVLSRASIATSILPTFAVAFAPNPLVGRRPLAPTIVTQYEPFTTRLYHSSPQRDQGFLEKAKSVAKKILPFLKSDEEKRAELARKRVRDDVQGSLTEVFKDAPLPIRMFGRAIAPILSNMMSSLAEMTAEQQDSVERVLAIAVDRIENDEFVASEIGRPVSVGAPFSQSSSTTSINGQSSTRIELAFPVSGPRGSGVGRVVSAGSNKNAGDNIQLLQVQIGSRVIPISTTVSSSRSKRSKYESNDDNIIEAEIIEKDTSKRP